MSSELQLGQLGALLGDPLVTDVLVNGVQVWVDRGAGLVRAPISMGSAEEVRRIAQRVAGACGRRLDDSCPFVDARLADGTRLHAVLPPIAVTGPYLSLRMFRHRRHDVADLVPAPLAELLIAIIKAKLTFLISGNAGSGKTTLLSAMLGNVSGRERIVIVEDAAELQPAHPHVVALQARSANVEGAGIVGLSDLVRQALRMRPDRIVVGEFRGAELVELMAALNTGHEGGAGTLHANGAADVPARLEALGLLAGVPRDALHAQVAAAIQVLLHLRRGADGRWLDSVCLLEPAGPQRLVNVWSVWQSGQGIGPAAPALLRLLASREVSAPAWLERP